MIPQNQLFGGKIIAALDRQHPRDLFDINYLLAEKGINDEMRKGLIFSLLSSNRPVYELLNPNFIDQRDAFESQFEGMSDQEFSYNEFELAREKLVHAIYGILKQEDKDFIISFKGLEPDWSIYDFSKYPSIQWKLENLLRFKAQNEVSYYRSYERLANFLELI